MANQDGVDHLATEDSNRRDAGIVWGDRTLARYVADAAVLLWTPMGSAARHYLKDRRGLPADVLEVNWIGADPGFGLLSRPPGMAGRDPGIVLPILDASHRCVSAQVRWLGGGHHLRYLDVPGRSAPRVGIYWPTHPCSVKTWIVTEGLVDALSAAAAGFPAAAVPGAGHPDMLVADALADLPGRLVVAFNGDSEGQAGASRLATLLADRGRRPARLVSPDDVHGLNGWLVAAAARWTTVFRSAVERCVHENDSVSERACRRAA